jgi:hypothetical protein
MQSSSPLITNHPIINIKTKLVWPQTKHRITAPQLFPPKTNARLRDWPGAVRMKKQRHISGASNNQPSGGMVVMCISWKEKKGLIIPWTAFFDTHLL